MKNTISIFRSALLVAALAFAPLTASLHAQTAQRVHVNVPFDFQDGSMKLPAGIYTLTQTNSNILRIEGKGASALVMSRVEGAGAKTPGSGKVVFHHIGDKYFLSEVWQADEPNHTVCITTSAELKAVKAAQATVAANPAATNVQIAAR